MVDAPDFFPTPTSRAIAERMGRPELARAVSQADLQALDALAIRRERPTRTIDEMMADLMEVDALRAAEEVAGFRAGHGRRADNDNHANDPRGGVA